MNTLRFYLFIKIFDDFAVKLFKGNLLFFINCRSIFRLRWSRLQDIPNHFQIFNMNLSNFCIPAGSRNQINFLVFPLFVFVNFYRKLFCHCQKRFLMKIKVTDVKIIVAKEQFDCALETSWIQFSRSLIEMSCSENLSSWAVHSRLLMKNPSIKPDLHETGVPG